MAIYLAAAKIVDDRREFLSQDVCEDALKYIHSKAEKCCKALDDKPPTGRLKCI